MILYLCKITLCYYIPTEHTPQALPSNLQELPKLELATLEESNKRPLDPCLTKKEEEEVEEI